MVTTSSAAGGDASPAARFHATATVEEGADVGQGTRVWHHSHIRAGSRVGSGCTIGFAVYVDAGATIGDRCKIQNHVSVYGGVELADDVFVGPGATFTNDRYPRSDPGGWVLARTFVGRGASIGANATVLPGVELGAWSVVAAGAVVTRDVQPHALVAGNPARQVAWVCRCGRPLARLGGPRPGSCRHCGRGTDGVMPP